MEKLSFERAYAYTVEFLEKLAAFNQAYAYTTQFLEKLAEDKRLAELTEQLRAQTLRTLGGKVTIRELDSRNDDPGLIDRVRRGGGYVTSFDEDGDKILHLHHRDLPVFSTVLEKFHPLLGQILLNHEANEWAKTRQYVAIQQPVEQIRVVNRLPGKLDVQGNHAPGVLEQEALQIRSLPLYVRNGIQSLPNLRIQTGEEEALWKRLGRKRYGDETLYNTPNLTKRELTNLFDPERKFTLKDNALIDRLSVPRTELVGVGGKPYPAKNIFYPGIGLKE